MLIYAPQGYLLFVKDRTLVAQPFDAKAIKTTGEPVPLAEQIGTDAVGLARFSVSRDGVLAYRTGESGSRLLWMDRSGKELDTLGDPAEYQDPDLSPAGRPARVRPHRHAFRQVGHLDPRPLARRELAVHVRPGQASPPSGLRAATRSSTPRIGTGRSAIYQKATSGSGEEKLLLKSDALVIPISFSPDGRFLAYQRQDPKTNWDLFILPMTGDAKPVPFRATPFREVQPRFSPDGRFIAYCRNESGRNEVYVQSYPGPGRTWQISTSGGTDPHWRRDGKELYYRGLDQKLMAVEIRGGDALEPGLPQACSRLESRSATRARSTFRTDRAEVSLRRAARPRRHDAHDRRPELVRGTGQVSRPASGIASRASLGAVALLVATSALSESPVTVVKAARLIDGRGGPPIAPAMVRIDGDRILEVAPSLAVPGGARVIDLDGATLCPGSSTCTRT